MPTLSAPDAQTISVYDAKHQEYLAMVSKKTDERNDVALAKESARETFMNMLPTDNASILDYGCGPGKDAAFFAEQGKYTVSAFDASSEMVKLAQSRSDKVNVWQSGFDQFTETNTDVFDGIWASSSLLHADRVDMPSHLTAIRSALTKDGIFFIGMKLGEGAQRDTIGRMYTFYQPDELAALLMQVGFNVDDEKTTTGTSVGLDGVKHGWVKMFAKKN